MLICLVCLEEKKGTMNNMKKTIICLVTIFSLLVITGCSKSNNLVGTWKGNTNDGLKTTFKFEKNGNVKYENEYGFASDGTYKIDGDTVTITLKSWNESKKYEFKIKDKKLSLTATDKYSPSYKDMVKE